MQPRVSKSYVSVLAKHGPEKHVDEVVPERLVPGASVRDGAAGAHRRGVEEGADRDGDTAVGHPEVRARQEAAQPRERDGAPGVPDEGDELLTGEVRVVVEL